MKFGEMQFGAVTLVLAKAILRKLRAEVTHHPIPGHLGDNARRRNAQADAVAIDDGGLGERKRNDRQTVDQDMFGRIGQGPERTAHGPVRSTQDINSIDLKVVNHPDGPDNLGFAGQFIVNLFAQLGRELFGILQLTMPKFLRQDCDRSHDRTSQRAAPRFINPGDADDADGAQFLFITKSATPIHGGRLRKSGRAESGNVCWDLETRNPRRRKLN
jgi:hypothetical protein